MRNHSLAIRRSSLSLEELEIRAVPATVARPLNQVFADNLYDAVLQRSSDAGGLTYWTSVLNQGATPTATANGFFNTPECQTLLVGSLYNWYLNRAAAPSESAYWTARLSGGSTVEQVKAGILGSPEFFQNAGGTNAGFLAALYQAVFNRTPDALGQATYGGALAGGTARMTIALQVLTSTEGVQDVVAGWYQLYLHRTADNTGLNFWTSAIQQGTLTDQQAAAGILASSEDLVQLGQPTQPFANVIVQWNQILDAATIAASAPPTDTSRDMAMVEVAMYDAIAAVDHTYQVFDPNNAIANLPTSALPGTSRQAAAAEAAYTVLVALFPTEQPGFQAELAATLAALPAGVSLTEGVALGQNVGNAVVAWRANDGWNNPAHITYTPGTSATSWQPTPGPAPGNNYQPPLEPWWGTLTPFALTSDTQFIVPAPPQPGSAEFAAGLAQVQSLGAVNSTTRTPDQTQIALFWNDAVTGKNATPPAHWLEIADQQALLAGNTLDASARLMAHLGIAEGDAGIAVWNAKYADNYVRPITYINGLTTATPPATAAYASLAWQSLLATPNHPSYVSGHSGCSFSAAQVLDAFYGSNVSFSTLSDGMPGVMRAYTSFDQAAQEAAMSRVYGGIHWLWDATAGQTLGNAVGNYVVQNFLQP